MLIDLLEESKVCLKVHSMHCGALDACTESLAFRDITITFLPFAKSTNFAAGTQEVLLGVNSFSKH